MGEESTKSGITVDQAAALIGRLVALGHGSDALVIPYDPGHAAVGGTPATAVTSITAGIDWDRGRVYVTPALALGVSGNELAVLKAHLRAALETLANVGRLARNKSLPDAERLKIIAGDCEAALKRPKTRSQAKGGSEGSPE